MRLLHLIIRPKTPAGATSLPVMRELPAPPPSEAPPAQSPAQTSPVEARQLLFDAIARGDADGLEALCREHRDVVATQAAAWREVPDPLRANPAAAAWYARGVDELIAYCATVS